MWAYKAFSSTFDSFLCIQLPKLIGTLQERETEEEKSPASQVAGWECVGINQQFGMPVGCSGEESR